MHNVGRITLFWRKLEQTTHQESLFFAQFDKALLSWEFCIQSSRYFLFWHRIIEVLLHHFLTDRLEYLFTGSCLTMDDQFLMQIASKKLTTAHLHGMNALFPHYL